MWQGFIPQKENPHVINPASGFIESANQRPVDSSYPYFIPGNYIISRGIAITERLSSMQNITPQDMMALQNDYYSVFAREARPMLLKYVKENELNGDAKKYLDVYKSWDLKATPDSKGVTVYQLWYDSLEMLVWKDELEKVKPPPPWPDEQTLLEAINRDSTFSYIDNINTPQKENLYELVTQALQKATVQLLDEEKAGRLEWTKFKNPTIYHLLGPHCFHFQKIFR